MAKKENDATYILDSKKGLPNKLLQADGSVTDIQGNTVVNADEAWDSKPALPNKWLNPDGTYSTLNEIIAGMVDTSIYVIVDELPSEGNPQKIYLVPDGKGGFVEYHWTGSKWDPIGTIDIDLSNYSTTQEMMNAIEAAGILTLNSAKTYTDEQIAGISANPQVFYWNGEIDQTGVDFWNNLIPYNHDSALTVIVGRIDGINYVPSIIYVTPNFLVEKSSSIHVYSYRYDNTFNSSSTSAIGLDVMDYTLVFQEDKQIRAIYSLHRSLQREILDTNNNYSQPYIPQYPGSPATKKYVDDHIGKSPVFFWDGYSSTTNANNITLWQQIYDAQLNDDCIVFHKWDVSSASTKLGYFVIKKQSFYDDYQNRIYSTSGETGVIHSASTSSITSDKYNVLVTLAAGTVTAVSELQTEHQSKSNILSCSQNYATPYTPLYDGSPATKKYVDDCITTSITDVLNTSY